MTKNRFFIVIAGIAAIAYLAGCSLFGTDDALVIGGGYINGYVETQDGAPLAGVTVNYSIPDEPVDEDAEAAAYATKGTQSVVTDDAGFFEINELIPGNYRLTFSKSAYTIGTDMVTLTPEGFFVISETPSEGEEEGEAKYEYTDEIIITLYAKIATASGNVFMETAIGTAPADGQTVVAMFQDRFFSSTTIDSYGDFSFSSLPAGPVAFYVRSFYDGSVFYDNLWLTTDYEVIWVDDGEGGVEPIEIEFLGEADLSDRNEALHPAVWSPSTESTDPFVTDTNLSQSFDVEEEIELTFNKAINPAAADLSLGKSTDGVSFIGDELDILVTWDAAFMMVTIDPNETLVINTQYLVKSTVEATDGYEKVESFTFRTQRGIDKIGSNVEVYDDIAVDNFNVDTAITINFNMTIDHIFETDIALQDTDDNFIFIAPTLTTTADTNDTLVVTPSQSLEDNMDYTVSWTVYSSLDNGTDSDTGAIIFATAEAALVAPDPVASFDLDDVLFEADWDTVSVAFEWQRALDTNLDYVDGYYIYATDTVNGVEEVLVADVPDPGPTDYSTTLVGTAWLDDTMDTFAVNVFDAWPDAAGDVQPFASYNAITFSIVSYVTDSAGEEILTSAELAFPPLDDTTVPTIAAPAVYCVSGVTPGAIAIPPNNAPGVAEVWTLTYTISEPIFNDLVEVSAIGYTGATPWGASTTKPSIQKAITGSQEITITLTYDGVDDATVTPTDTLSINVRDTSYNQGAAPFTF